MDVEQEVLTIEDEDGFSTTWPWPAGLTILGNAQFVTAFETLHEAAREAAEGEEEEA